MNHQPQEHNSVPNFWSTRYAIGLFVIGGVAAYFLLTEHLAHVVGVLPFLLLLACPLMHIFMHGGHGHHHHQQKNPDTSDNKKSREPGDPSRSCGISLWSVVARHHKFGNFHYVCLQFF